MLTLWLSSALAGGFATIDASETWLSGPDRLWRASAIVRALASCETPLEGPEAYWITETCGETSCQWTWRGEAATHEVLSCAAREVSRPTRSSPGEVEVVGILSPRRSLRRTLLGHGSHARLRKRLARNDRPTEGPPAYARASLELWIDPESVRLDIFPPVDDDASLIQGLEQQLGQLERCSRAYGAVSTEGTLDVQSGPFGTDLRASPPDEARDACLRSHLSSPSGSLHVTQLQARFVLSLPSEHPQDGGWPESGGEDVVLPPPAP